uniref:Uncharacterized protein n=2 Tax=Anguilla anguilla TaxID=7936 RepID=A0A0E9R617_ANGAN
MSRSHSTPSTQNTKENYFTDSYTEEITGLRKYITPCTHFNHKVQQSHRLLLK